MPDREMKKKSRAELMDMINALLKQNELLRNEKDQLLEMVEAKEIAVEEAGSIAEAALRLNHVFEAAQAAADQYLDQIRIRAEADEEKNKERE